MPYTSSSHASQQSESLSNAQARDRALLPLAGVFGEVLDTLEAPLEEMAQSVPELGRGLHVAAVTLRRDREALVARFRDQLEQAWQALHEGRAQTIEDVLAAPDTGTLSLVSDQELDSRLSVRELAAQIRRGCKEQVSLLDRRVGRLMGRLGLETGQNPIGPEHVAAAVYVSLSACGFEPEVQSRLLSMCEGRLASALAHVYASLNEWMAQVGVKPAAPAAPNPRASEPRPEHAGLDIGDVEPRAADEQSAPAWASRFLGRMPGGMDGLAAMQSIHGMAGMDPAALQGAGLGGPALGEVPLPAGGEMPPMQAVLLEALHYMLQQTRSSRAPAAAAGVAGAGLAAGVGVAAGMPGAGNDAQGAAAEAVPKREMSQNEILSVLSLMQATPGVAATVAANDSEEPLTQRLKREVFSGATQLGVDPSSVRLSPADEDVIDLVGLLFDVMLDERDLNGRSRQLLGKLVVPFVKVAMLDRRMFVQKTHPARRLLNALAEACEGNDGARPASRNLLAKVEEVVERLLAEFNESVAIFQVLEEEFRAYLEQYRRGVEVAERRAAEAQRGQERLEAARKRAQDEVQQRLGDKALPQAIRDFLSQPWLHYVTLAALRDDGDGRGLAVALAIGDDLLAELARARAQESGRAWLQGLQTGLLAVFASVGVTDMAAERAVDALRDTLKSVAETRPELEKLLPELPEVAPVKAPEPAQGNAVLELVGGTDTLDFDQSDASHFRQLPVGTWLDFVDKDNKVHSCKLSWISPISSRLLFVNRRGVHYCVASPEELAAMVRLGRLRPHQNQDAFDSAMQGVIDRLEPGVA